MKKTALLILVLGLLLSGCGVSHAYTQPSEEAAASATISPLPADVGLDNLKDCTVAVSLEAGDIFRNEDGAVQLRVTVYSYWDRYDPVDIAGLKVGDELVIEGNTVPVRSLEEEKGDIRINGGYEQDGYTLRTDDDGVYYAVSSNDMHLWKPVGTTVLPVADSFVYFDRADLSGAETAYSAEDFLAGALDHSFSPQNTALRLENGEAVELIRFYTP